MAVELDQSLRAPESYALARNAIDAMERRGVWPTPLNFEIWLHVVADPAGALGQEVERLARSGDALTESVAEQLAERHLPRNKLGDEIRDAGDQLSRQLRDISTAIQSAQQSNADYGRTLAGATAELEVVSQGNDLKKMVQTLADATRLVQTENVSLEQRLSESTSEVSRLRERLEQVRREAMTDALTGLGNRKALDEKLDRECAAADDSGEPLVLALIDIDHFKRFNDTWGHQTGDQVLRYVATVIKRLGQGARMAARFGGEEFAIVLPGATARSVRGELEAVREEIGSRALKRRSTNEDLGSVTVSVGMAEHRAGEPSSLLLERADEALYASKRSGRNRVSLSSGRPGAPRDVSSEAAA